MQRPMPVTIAVLLLLWALGAETARADGGKGVAVSPLIPKSGDTITVKGDQLGGNSSVEVRVVGSGVDFDLGEVKADGAGDFTAQFRLPADLNPGSYQVRAAGTETATTQITVVGGSAENAASPMAEIPVRSRPFGQALVLIVFFVALAGLGLFLAGTAREPARP